MRNNFVCKNVASSIIKLSGYGGVSTTMVGLKYFLHLRKNIIYLCALSDARY